MVIVRPEFETAATQPARVVSAVQSGVLQHRDLGQDDDDRNILCRG